MKPAIAAILGGLAMIAATPVAGQQCSRDDPVEHLSRQFGEAVHAVGTAQNGSILVRVFGNAETGTWTIIMSQAAPPTHCIIGAGEGFDVVRTARDPQPQGTSASYARP
jgi:hypothetical protein